MTPEEYVAMHKEAFRTAFNYLNGHFPPGDDPEWWDKSAKELSEASVLAGENVLVIELLNAVYNYLGDEYKKRNGEHNGEADG